MGEPFATLLSVAKVLTSFNLDVLRVSCVATLSPLEIYISRVCIIGIGFVTILFVFAIHTILLDRGEFRKMSKKLMLVLGVLSATLFMSVVSIVTAPWQCTKHPCGDWTVRTFPTVLCSTSSDFLTMLAVASVVSLLPSGLLSLVAWAVYVFPQRMQRVDTAFFETTSFLFVCYRPETYWFSLAI